MESMLRFVVHLGIRVVLPSRSIRLCNRGLSRVVCRSLEVAVQARAEKSEGAAGQDESQIKWAFLN